QVLVGLHLLPGRPVSGELELLLGDPMLRSGHAELALAQPTVEKRHFDRDRRTVAGVVHPRPSGNVARAHAADVLQDIAADDDARIEVRLRLADLGLALTDRR